MLFAKKYEERNCMTQDFTFTFGVMAYNHEDFICEILESIKYQIIKFGKNEIVRLVITDDFSSDATVKKIENWLISNRSLFAEVKTIFNKENYGISHNFNLILDEINNENFKVIAGDDVISNSNIFSASNGIGEHSLLQFLHCRLHNYCIEAMEPIELMGVFWKMKHCNISRFSLLKQFLLDCSLIHTPSTLFSKKLYRDSDAKKLNIKFKFLEDAPTWYSMIKNVDNFTIDFKPVILVLYRISDRSITHSESASNSKFKDDVSNLNQYYIEKEGLINGLYVKSKISTIPKYFKISSYVAYFERLLWKVNAKIYNTEYKKFVEFVKEQTEAQKLYYEYIHKQAETKI